MLMNLGKKAKEAAMTVSIATTETKNRALQAIATALMAEKSALLAANAKDVEAAIASELSPALIDRLQLTSDRIDNMVQEIQTVIQLPDPVGEVLDGRLLPSGLQLSRRRVPLGVVGVIYEARPNVTLDISALCIKTGNCAILRGGKETTETNRYLLALIQTAIITAGLPKETIQMITDPDRAYIMQLLQLDRYVDMIIPRGGAALQRLCQQHATIPVILGGIGVCHLYLDQSADGVRSLPVILNAKMQRPSTCNALETLLIHHDQLSDFIPLFLSAIETLPLRLHVDQHMARFLESLSLSEAQRAQITLVTEEELGCEWLSNDLNVVVVDSIDDALTHIQRYGSGHSEGILTESLSAATHFTQNVNAAAVYVNASTRFTDGAQFGLGAEVAVSTQKLHARGPMGLEALTTYQWIGYGDYLSRP